MTTTLSAVLMIIVVLASMTTCSIYIVDANSMRPLLVAGDIVLCTKLFSVAKGDIVVAKINQQNQHIIKRVSAVPGDTVPDPDISATPIFIREAKAIYPQKIQSPIPAMHKLTGDEYFLLGDNRHASVDSRHFGPVPASAILCQARVVFWNMRKNIPVISRIQFL